MPDAPKKPCGHLGCSGYAERFGYCEAHTGDHRQANTKTDAEQAFYNSTAWKKKRAAHRKSEPFCRRCNTEGRFVLGEMVDHIVPMREGGSPFDDDNLQTLCNFCHNRKRQTEKNNSRISEDAENRRFPKDISKSRIPLFIVCGPPGSGKSTYVRENSGPKDLVIDLDSIFSLLSRLPEHSNPTGYLAEALDIRNAKLRGLATDTKHERAWFIITAPRADERTAWAAMLGASVVVMDTPKDECIRRINADVARDGHREWMISAVHAWYESN